jgi:hypothetical protein
MQYRAVGQQMQTAFHRNRNFLVEADQSAGCRRGLHHNVNRSLRAWANYFHYRNSSVAMCKVRHHAENRLRTHLMKRHKVKDRGTGLRQFRPLDLYERYGLYKVPVVAGWRSAHALA